MASDLESYLIVSHDVTIKDEREQHLTVSAIWDVWLPHEQQVPPGKTMEHGSILRTVGAMSGTRKWESHRACECVAHLEIFRLQRAVR